MIPKNLKVTISVCSLVLVIYLVSKVTKSNSAQLNYTFVKADSVGADGGDIPTIGKLNELVEKNFLDRNYYEVSSFETTSWSGCYANYNKKYQSLCVGTSDGWSYYFMQPLHN